MILTTSWVIMKPVTLSCLLDFVINKVTRRLQTLKGWMMMIMIMMVMMMVMMAKKKVTTTTTTTTYKLSTCGWKSSLTTVATQVEVAKHGRTLTAEVLPNRHP